jgi:hypothetical protein
MSSPEFKPWWTKVNQYLDFQERTEFVQGAKGLNPNLPHDILMGMLSTGYINNKFEKPQSHTGKKK